MKFNFLTGLAALSIACCIPIVSEAQPTWINVKSQGATGNGTTDDTAAILNAISAAAASTQTRTVYFPCGTYAFTGLTITAPVILQGDSNSCSKLQYTPTSGTAITENYGTSDNQSVGIRDLAIVGPLSNFADSQATVGLELGGTSGAAGFLAQRVVVSNFGTGIRYGNNTYLTIFESSLIHYNAVDLVYPTGLTNSGENIQFTNTLFADTGAVYTSSLGPCIELQGGAELTINGGSLDDCQLDVAYLAGAIVKLTNVHVEWPGGNLNNSEISMEDPWSIITMQSPSFYSGHYGTQTSNVSISAGYFFAYGLWAADGSGTNMASVIALSGTAVGELFGVGRTINYNAAATTSGSATLTTY